MRNTVPGSVKQFKAPAYDENSRQRFYGWHDYRMGLGFRKEYETWTHAAQRRYEAGRGLAAVAKYEWGVVENWKPTDTFQQFVTKAFDLETRAVLLEENNFRIRDQRKPY